MPQYFVGLDVHANFCTFVIQDQSDHPMDTQCMA